MRKSAYIIGLLLLMPLVAAFADGGGGVTFGLQTTSYPFLQNLQVPSNSAGLVYYGGYGYGVSGDHGINGGFGYAITDPINKSSLIGGFGGVISGVRLLKLPINLSIVSWTGFGGVYTGLSQTLSGSNTIGKGFFCLSEEVTVELGIPLQRWFMPVFFAGYQVAGNIVPGQTFQTFLSYAPVIGMRLAWGKFY